MKESKPRTWAFARPGRLGYSTWIYRLGTRSINDHCSSRIAACHFCQSILTVLTRYGPLHLNGLCRVTGTGPSTLQRHLKDLMEAHVVAAELCKPEDFHKYLARTYLALGDVLERSHATEEMEKAHLEAPHE